MKKSSKAGPKPIAPDWSNRILILAVAGILFMTLYPFWFDFHVKLPVNASPFLLQSGMKGGGVYDDFLNILLFAPFGFGLAAKFRRRGFSGRTTLILALIAGAVFSYGIEFLQNYVPSRDSGWHDVFTNTAGSVAGFAAFELFGKLTLRFLATVESALAKLLIPWRAAWVICLYFVICFCASIYLQREAEPRNWDPSCLLVVGNAAAGRPGTGWRGEFDRLEFWEHAIPGDIAGKLTTGDRTAVNSFGSTADYEFSGAGPYKDAKGNLPDLAWKTSVATSLNTTPNIMDGKSWLTSAVPVTKLIRNIEKANQFSIHLVCAPSSIEGVDSRIVTISRASGLMDLDLRQEDANLVFWFRNPLSASHAILAWYIPNAFAPNQKRDILFTYDGANLSLYVDGQKESKKYELGPGTVLARLIRRVKPSELEGYKYIYYALLFFPAGILLGIACRGQSTKRIVMYFLLGAALVIPPIVLEIIFVHFIGRTRSIGDIALGFFLAVGGSLWINSDVPGRNTAFADVKTSMVFWK